jgi:YhcH/YjgK/YiaL family protein
MIVDKIENSHKYNCLSKYFVKAFSFLKNTNLVNAESGKYVLEGDRVFAMVQEYDSRKIEDCKLEAHRKYIDIQFIVSGEEQIGVNLLKDQPSMNGYNENNDIIFFEGDSSLVKMEAGMFAIFYPDDLHMPGVKVDQSLKVKKVVVKVQV